MSALTLDTAAFPNAATLIGNAVLGRLNVTMYKGNTDADAAFEQLYSFGARSFSVRDEEGRLVFDSGDALEQITKLRNPVYFNANHTNNVNIGNPNDWTHDSRSDDKGPEPENVKVAKLFGRDFAFIVLERIGGVMIYELVDPTRPTFVDYVNTRVFGVARRVCRGRGPRPRRHHRRPGRGQPQRQAAAHRRQRGQRHDAHLRDRAAQEIESSRDRFCERSLGYSHRSLGIRIEGADRCRSTE